MTTQRQFVTMEQIEPSKISQSVRSNSVKYMKWGQSQNNIQNYYNHHHSNLEKNQNNESQDLLPQSKIQINRPHYQCIQGFTEFGDGGFKKNKTTQLYKLSQLKHEYQILKSIKIQDQIRQKKHLKKQNSMSSSYSSASISKKSKQTRNRKKSNNNNINDFYDRQQLQIMLNQSMKKIQQLLNNQIQHKRLIHQLTYKVDNFQDEKQRSNMPNNIDLHRQKQLQTQIERLRTNERRYIQKIGFLEGEIAVKQIQIKNKIQENIILNKELSSINNRIIDNDLQLKRLSIQNEFMVKQKVYMVEKYDKKDDIQNKQLNKQLSIKQQQNENLLKQINELKLQNENIKQIVERIQSSSDNTMINQIRILKSKIQNLSINQPQQDQQTLQSRIQQLEKIINDENEEKIKFVEQLSSMAQQYKKLKQKIQQMQIQQKRLKIQIQNLKNQLSASQNANLSLSNSRIQLSNIQIKVKFLQNVQRQNQTLQEQLKVTKKQKNKNTTQYQQIIRQFKRKVDQKDFQIQKTKKQNIFNLQLDDKKAKAQMQLCKNSQKRAQSERDQWKKQYQNLKQFYQQKQNFKQSQYQRLGQQYNQKLMVKIEENEKIKQQNDQVLKNIRQRYEQQQSNLIMRLDSLTKTNERFISQNQKHIKMQSELFQLRQKYKVLSSLNDNVNHLWKVKELEYHHINELLKTVNNR